MDIKRQTISGRLHLAVSGRIEDYRIYNRIDTLAEHFITDWGVDLDQ